MSRIYFYPPNWTRNAVGTAFLLFGVLFTGLGIGIPVYQKHDAETKVAAWGKVISVNAKYGVFYPRVAFKPKDKDSSVVFLNAQSTDYHEGDTVTVLYNLANPADAAVQDSKANLLLMVVFSGLGGIFFIIGIFGTGMIEVDGGNPMRFWFQVMFFGGGVFGAAGVMWSIVQEFNAAATHQQVAGNVTDIQHYRGRTSSLIEFLTEKNERTLFFDQATLSVGDTVAVRYNPKNRHQAILNTFANRWLNIIAFSVVSVVFFLCGWLARKVLKD